MIESLRPAAAVAVCLMAAALILLFGNRIHRNLREAITVIAAICAAGLIFSMAPAVAAGHVYEARLWQIAEGIKLGFRTDAAGMVFACIASFLWILTSVYSIGYMRGHHEKNQTGYFAAFAVCVGSALGIALAANLMTFFIFYEMLTIATYPLVAHGRDTTAKSSGRKYLAYTLISGQLFFRGNLRDLSALRKRRIRGGWIFSKKSGRCAAVRRCSLPVIFDDDRRRRG